MSETRFLSSESLWAEIVDRVPTAKLVYAAIAYFGQNGEKLLPLRKGHRLVVDMSIRAVKQGVTDPREVRKLMRNGVQVYSRGTLHSKFIIFDNSLLVGSANISMNSRDRLDEAAILTTDPAAVRRAKTFFLDHMCVEPVREEYLNNCIEAYRPHSSRATAGRATSKRKSRSRAVEAKVWFVSALYADTLKNEESRVTSARERSKRLLKDPKHTEAWPLRYVRVPPYFQHIRAGDWVVNCCCDKDKRREVLPPAQVLEIKSYKTNSNRPSGLIMLETPIDGESMSLSKFRRRIRSIVPGLDRDSPRTRPITDGTKADRILMMWTPRGRISTRGKSR